MCCVKSLLLGALGRTHTLVVSEAAGPLVDVDVAGVHARAQRQLRVILGLLKP